MKSITYIEFKQLAANNKLSKYELYHYLVMFTSEAMDDIRRYGQALYMKTIGLNPAYGTPISNMLAAYLDLHRPPVVPPHRSRNPQDYIDPVVPDYEEA